ncbi:ROK family transcriptional regulator [Microbacterium capsulatum]|uniref:ROK family transcriptional regulator n=1 Tax=Microbacterium capsulatum TaxID=3041921 RepID=A0ABU0XE94_9MICO|nr:ROK family transcriptional regulator [Microbacterium sp. ASV81]MDQ4212505.1 ROK family transcriptional regulator [Microbacterium sp. ASV81]
MNPSPDRLAHDSAKPDPAGDHARRIVELVARGEAASRSDLAGLLGLAPSTVSLRVQELVDAGILREDGQGRSSGGRRPRRLTLGSTQHRVLAAELGGEHARLGLLDFGGHLHRVRTIPIRIADGPEATLDLVEEGLRALAEDADIRGIGIALPGPVRFETGSVDQPSRMPGWPGFRVGEALTERFGVPAAVDNDANLMALGEHYRSLTREQHSITVKAGTAIGSGIIVAGSVHRGATAAAGDITHTLIDDAADIPCSCGNHGCLETVASGAGLVRQMQERGIDVSTAAEVLERARNGDPIATSLVRTAGTRLGQVLSGVVNFFNPHAVFLTGSMSASEPFLAAVRSRVYEACHPLATQTLRIESAQTGPDAALYGAARLAMEQIDPVS